VLARSLAATGKRVVLLEAEPVVRPEELTPDDTGSTFARYFWDGGLRMVRGHSTLRTAQSRALGGCSVFNMAICTRAPDSAFERWSEEHGTSVSRAELDPHYQAMETLFEVGSTEEAVQGGRNSLFREG